MAQKRRIPEKRNANMAHEEKCVRTLGENKTEYATRTAKMRNIVPLSPKDWDKYRGETIAFIGGKILAHGPNLDRVLDQVWTRYGKKPNQVGLIKIAKSRHKLL